MNGGATIIWADGQGDREKCCILNVFVLLPFVRAPAPQRKDNVLCVWIYLPKALFGSLSSWWHRDEARGMGTVD